MHTLTDEHARARAAARESAHAAVAEHYGLEVYETGLDWRGFPVCRYRGEVAPPTRAHTANLVILLAGPVGERLAAGLDWRTPGAEVEPWLGDLELDPGDHPDSAFDADLVLALRAVGGEMSRLRELEDVAQALLSRDATVSARWRALRAELLDLPRA